MIPLVFYEKVFIQFLLRILIILGVDVNFRCGPRGMSVGVFMVFAVLAFVYTITTSDMSMALQSMSMFIMPIEVGSVGIIVVLWNIDIRFFLCVCRVWQNSIQLLRSRRTTKLCTISFIDSMCLIPMRNRIAMNSFVKRHNSFIH